MEKRIEIVDDVNDVITFDEITRDTVSRTDVAKAEERIAVLEKEIAEKTEELETLKENLEKAKHIIALADEKKAKELEEQANVNADVVAENV